MMRTEDQIRQAASAGGKARAQALDADARRAIARKGARLGGLARARNLSKRQRSEQARHAAKARWAKRIKAATP